MKKYWHPIKEVVDTISKICENRGKILEVGPGDIPFPKSTHYCDWQINDNVLDTTNYTFCDFSKERLPYTDKEFDFVYCRHVLEDLYNPFLLVDEMSRVAKAGYIEIPSPLSEMCKSIDIHNPLWRGYQHHRYFVWSHSGKLYFLAKYPKIEYIQIDENGIRQDLEEHPVLWNCYHLWEDTIEYKHFEHPKDFHIIADYDEFIINKVIPQSYKSSIDFYNFVTKNEKYD